MKFEPWLSDNTGVTNNPCEPMRPHASPGALFDPRGRLGRGNEFQPGCSLSGVTSGDISPATPAGVNLCVAVSGLNTRRVRVALTGGALAFVGLTAQALGFDEAVAATLIGPRPGAAFFLVEWLEQRGQAERAGQLKRELWHLQLAQMRGAPAPPALTVGEAIAQGAQQPERDAAFQSAWRQAYNAAVTLSFWPTQPTASWQAMPLPASIERAPDLRPVEAGLWTQARGDQHRFVLAVRLQTLRDVALPPQALGLRFGSADNGLSLACRTEPPAADPQELERQSFSPGSRHELVCEGLGDSRWALMLPVLLDAARIGGTPPELLPRDPSVGPKNPERRLWQQWGAYEIRLRDWNAAGQKNLDPAHARRPWRVGPRVLDPPELEPLPATAVERGRAAMGQSFSRVQHTLAVSVLAIGIFGLGRLLLRQASMTALTWATFGIAAVPQAMWLLVLWSNKSVQSGDSWARWAVFGAGLVGASTVGMAAVLAVLLHWLHRLLDEEQLGWPQVIGSGWRQAFWMFGKATRGEFWGFVIFALWLWAFAAALGQPWTSVTGAVLFVPLWSLCWRRALSFSAAEIGVGLSLLAVAVLERLV